MSRHCAVCGEVTAELEQKTRSLEIVRGNAERWEKLALQYKRELEKYTVGDRRVIEEGLENE